jgi:lipopolysaccharide/colanic/teichoic acid biosynthesis glycosyltransferase
VRLRLPASHTSSRLRFSPFDVVWAAMSPLAALYLRNAPILANDGLIPTGIYCLSSLVFTLAAFTAFRVYIGIPQYFSFNDAIDLTRAVVIGELMTSIVLFTFTRLDGIPRSIPVIHALLLWVGLLGARGLVYRASTSKSRKLAASPPDYANENLILIGLNDLSVSFLNFLNAAARDTKRVIAVLDTEQRWIGRAVNGVGVLGKPAHLNAIIEEFAVHGVFTNRVAVAGRPDIVSDQDLAEVRRVCAQRNLDLIFLNSSFGVDRAQPEDRTADAEFGHLTTNDVAPALVVSSYFRVKPLIDFFVSLVVIVGSAPLWLLAAPMAWLFVGSPIFFWQQRMGLGGRRFDLYKVRTLRPPFERSGQKVSESERLSFAGRLLRATRLDELPQLLNVLVGDMSFVGPRPLLPQDQPANPVGRLRVRPGITGWAQVNGGGLLSADEKEALDRWYIRNATLWLDLRIIALTALMMIRGDRRDEQVLARTPIPTIGEDIRVT